MHGGLLSLHREYHILVMTSEFDNQLPTSDACWRMSEIRNESQNVNKLTIIIEQLWSLDDEQLGRFQLQTWNYGESRVVARKVECMTSLLHVVLTWLRYSTSK